MAQKRIYKAGLDIGSTTAKIILLDSQDRTVFSDYRRHHADIGKTVDQFLNRISEMDPGCYLDLRLTGSAALDTAEGLSLPFVQEVVAMHGVVQKRYPEIRTAVDIGGEDSKMVFFKPGRPPDIRMNGSCAGGTGSFIDQMADLMGLSPLKLNLLAAEGRRIHPVASRCGVFAKTDVQNMLSRNVPHADIAASIF
ncbi:MAG: CoA protein activase, partial [Desulfobacterales bacterium]|nr:CoA protein activase [Desulfobacterales bacterium]